MRGFWRALLAAVAAISCATAIYLVLTLPPRSLDLGGALPPNHIPGAFHVHSNRSDGTGTVDEIAAAAARAGLSFVILTDHGDGTRAPDAPSYRHGVLCIDAVELGSDSGHVIALGLTAATPYPLGGDPRDVIDDVHRLGGLAIAAHPDSPVPGLRWRGNAQDLDGLEWMNIDAEWRDDQPLVLLRTAFQSILRAPEAIATLFDRPTQTFQRWDNLLQSRHVVSVAALDAHARIPWRETEEPRGATALARPTYEAMFRTLTQVAILPTGLSGDAARDAAQILSAVGAGQSYSVVTAYARPATLTFRAQQAGRTIEMGQTFDANGGPVTFSASVAQAPGALVRLIEGGRVVASGSRVTQTVTAPGPSYRVEVSLPRRDRPSDGRRLDRPWVVSNAISQARVPEPPVVPAAGEAGRTLPLPVSGVWEPEHDASSGAAVVADGETLALTYTLGKGEPRGQFGAVAVPGISEAGADRVQFVARGSQPMRLSVQLRLPGGKDGLRWRRSVFVDTTPRLITVRLRDLTPVGPTTTSQRPFVAPVHRVLFVVDTVNTAPGTTGTVWLSELAVGLGPSGGLDERR